MVLLLIVIINSIEFLQISEDNAQYGEIPLVFSFDGKALVFVKDSQQWINQFCKIQVDGKRAVAKRRHVEVEGDEQGPSSPPSKKRKVTFLTPKASFYQNRRGAPKSYKVDARFLNSTSDIPSSSKAAPQITKEAEVFFRAIKGSSASSSSKHA